MSTPPREDFRGIFKRRSAYFPDPVTPLVSGFRAFLDFGNGQTVPLQILFDYPSQLFPNQACDCGGAILNPEKHRGSFQLHKAYKICLGYKIIGDLSLYDITNVALADSQR